MRTTTDWFVVSAGVAAIAWVNWYFFFAQRSSATAAVTGGAQQVEVEVKGGYEPGVIRVKRGLPVRLVFNRQETSSNIRRSLPAFQRTSIEFTPDKPGAFDITCGMSMLHAKLVVED